MIYSMTGFGSGFVAQENREMSIDLKSVNNRYLDISMRLPKFLMFLENDIRQLLSGRLARGHIDVFLMYKNKREDAKRVSVDTHLFNSYMRALEAIRDSTGITDDMSFSTVLRMPDVLALEEAEDDKDIMMEICLGACNQAIDQMLEMRAKEAKRLCADMLERINIMESMLVEIEKIEPLVVENYRNKLELRMQELLTTVAVDPNRLAVEVAYFSERCSINEETVRLRSHLELFKETIAQGGVIGKKLDFAVQEMNREVNTIGSKANDLSITNTVMALKNEVEKIREQIQNIE